MSRGAGVVCAGALLLAAGCSLDSFLVSFAGPGGKPRSPSPVQIQTSVLAPPRGK